MAKGKSSLSAAERKVLGIFDKAIKGLKCPPQGKASGRKPFSLEAQTHDGRDVPLGRYATRAGARAAAKKKLKVEASFNEVTMFRDFASGETGFVEAIRR